MSGNVGHFEDLLFLGMKRSPGKLIEPPSGPHLNLGCGFSSIDGATNLDKPGWQAPWLTGYAAESIAVVHAYHFLEHLEFPVLVDMLQEIQRVLMHGGVLNICVPHAAGMCAYMDLSHRTFWTEESFKVLLGNEYYDGSQGRSWKLEVTYCVIAGVAVRNLAILAQLVKR